MDKAEEADVVEIRFKIFRFDPERDKGPYYKYYTVKAEPHERLLDCLNRIKWEQDGTLAFRMSCGHGICGSDGMKINGTCGLACQKLVKDYQCPEVVIEPLPFFPVKKDLIVDMDRFFEQVYSFLPEEGFDEALTQGERMQSPEQARKTEDVIRCILCACCTAACPVYFYDRDYIGPAALVQAFRYVFDSRNPEGLKWLKRLDRPDGVWPCVNHFECTRVCPKEIPVTRSINRLKREIKERLR